MARSIRFFMRPAEFADVLWTAVARFGLHVVFRGPGATSLVVAPEPGSLTLPNGRQASDVFLSRTAPSADQLRTRSARAVVWGWASGRVPREQDATLFIGDLGAKSDWFDRSEGRFRDNPESIEIFQEVVPLFRKRLSRPVWVGAASGDHWRPSTSIGYSAGALEWTTQHGLLRDDGSNALYAIEPPDPSGDAGRLVPSIEPMSTASAARRKTTWRSSAD